MGCDDRVRLEVLEELVRRPQERGEQIRMERVSGSSWRTIEPGAKWTTRLVIVRATSF